MPACITTGMKLEWAEPVDADEEDFEVGFSLIANLLGIILQNSCQVCNCLRARSAGMASLFALLHVPQHSYLLAATLAPMLSHQTSVCQF